MIEDDDGIADGIFAIMIGCAMGFFVGAIASAIFLGCAPPKPASAASDSGCTVYQLQIDAGADAANPGM